MQNVRFEVEHREPDPHRRKDLNEGQAPVGEHQLEAVEEHREGARGERQRREPTPRLAETEDRFLGHRLVPLANRLHEPPDALTEPRVQHLAAAIESATPRCVDGAPMRVTRLPRLRDSQQLPLGRGILVIGDRRAVVQGHEPLQLGGLRRRGWRACARGARAWANFSPIVPRTETRSASGNCSAIWRAQDVRADERQDREQQHLARVSGRRVSVPR